MRDLEYLKLLSETYPTLRSAAAEIINLQAIESLPKGTEYFFSDLHGENEAFIYLLRSSSGIIRQKITETFGHFISETEEIELANLIYFPEREIRKVRAEGGFTEDYQKIAIYRLVRIAKVVSSKYTRHKVFKKIPKDFAYIIDELLNVNYNDANKKVYFDRIVRTIIENDITEIFICDLCRLIQDLTIDNLHILGDIYDRGPRADFIMEELMQFHDVDIQWGNHDIAWMGAFCGNRALICDVVRMAISYNSFDILEDGYGINLRPLSMFAAKVYGNDPCKRFLPHEWDKNVYDTVDSALAAKMHKAISIIQFKLEGQILKRHPEYGMDSRNMLLQIDYEKGTVKSLGRTYALKDTNFPTVDPANPLKLTREEEELLRTLEFSFRHGRMLGRHIGFLYSNGSIYKICNGNLLYHGCIPMDKNGEFQTMMIDGKAYAGRALMDKVQTLVKNAYYLSEDDPEKQKCVDFMWYLQCGPKSPLFGKDHIATFEQYFVDDEAPKREKLNAYYQLNSRPEICDKILAEFGLSGKSAHIINGHVPVRAKEGESPVKAGGKLYIIDGGLSKAYQKKTGIAGYTLIYNSWRLMLAEHKPFNPNSENSPELKSVEEMSSRVMISDTDGGRAMEQKIEDLRELVAAYRSGTIREKNQTGDRS